MEIGVVKNSINAGCIELWFYRKSLKDDRWKRIGVERMPLVSMEYYLKKLSQKSKVIILGVGPKYSVS